LTSKVKTSDSFVLFFLHFDGDLHQSNTDKELDRLREKISSQLGQHKILYEGKGGDGSLYFLLNTPEIPSIDKSVQVECVELIEFSLFERFKIFDMSSEYKCGGKFEAPSYPEFEGFTSMNDLYNGFGEHAQQVKSKLHSPYYELQKIDSWLPIFEIFSKNDAEELKKKLGNMDKGIEEIDQQIKNFKPSGKKEISPWKLFRELFVDSNQPVLYWMKK
jgi:hypothetical protein